MKSIKPGRGPSFLSFGAGIGVALFGVFWCIMAAGMGAFFMIPFGIIFVALAIGGSIYNYKNATSKNRYSTFDIVDDEEEDDPLNVIYGRKNEAPKQETGSSDYFTNFANTKSGTSVAFCPFCGKEVDSSFDFCPKCGKQLPD